MQTVRVSRRCSSSWRRARSAGGAAGLLISLLVCSVHREFYGRFMKSLAFFTHGATEHRGQTLLLIVIIFLHTPLSSMPQEALYLPRRRTLPHADALPYMLP